MLANDNWWLVPILLKTWQCRKEAIFAPPVEDEVGSFLGKRTMEDFVASINASDYCLTGARIFQVSQFLNDKVHQGAILLWFHNHSALRAFYIYPDAGCRREHLAAVP